MVRVTVGRENVTLRLEGSTKLLALKSSIVIPLSKIEKVSTEQVGPFWLPRMRVGTHLPGVFTAGTFWVREGKTFFYVHDPSRCVTFYLKGHEYRRVVVEVDGGDKEAVAAKVNAAMAR
jgi:hypothetical protein